MGIKITVIGAGSSYTPELFADILELPYRMDVEEVALLDINQAKVESIARVSEQLLESAGRKIRVRSTTRREEALRGADFILLQIRVGGLAARVRDETLPLEFDRVGNETTGPGGFVCALRTVTAAMDLAPDIEKYAPKAVLLNLANPAGIVTEAILNHTRVRTLGFCNIPTNVTYRMAELFKAGPAQIRLDYLGLNHLGWIRGVYVDGKERLQDLIEQTYQREDPLYAEADELMDPDWLRGLGMVPTWYVRFFYFPEKTLEEDRRSGPKGEQDRIAEKRLAELYASEGYGDEARHILSSKGGAQYYIPVLQAIDSMVHDRGDIIVADVRNGRATPDLPENACVELPARICATSMEPLPVGPLPLKVRGLVQAVKAYEQLTIEAALTGNYSTAIAALMANPLVSSYTTAKAFFDRALENERDFLPQFYKK